MSDQLILEKDFFPYLNDKVVLDLVQGLRNSNRLQRSMKDRTGIMTRILDGLSGKNHRKQGQINDHLIAGLEGCQIWLQTLTDQSFQHTDTIEQLKLLLENHQQDFLLFIDKHHELKQEFKIFKAVVDDTFSDIQKELKKINIKIEAKNQIDRLFNAWEVQDQNFIGLAPIERVYYVLECLSHGPYQTHMRHLNGHQTEIVSWQIDLQNRLLKQLREDLNLSKKDDIRVTTFWLERSQECPNRPHQSRVLEYLGEFSSNQTRIYPLVYLSSQWNTVSESEKKHLTTIPYLLSAQQIIKGLQREIIFRGQALSYE